MYESTVERFPRSANNDMFVTFFPILLAFGLRGLLQNRVSQAAFLVLQIVMAICLVIWIFLIFRYYFRAFHYILVGDESIHSYPARSLTFERVINKRSRIYERVMSGEMLCLLTPGESYDAVRFGPVADTYVLTPLQKATAMRLYYKQGEAVYCAMFHPNTEQIQLLKRWICENDGSID